MILIILAAQIILYSLTIYNENLSYTSTYAYIWQIVVQVHKNIEEHKTLLTTLHLCRTVVYLTEVSLTSVVYLVTAFCLYYV